MPDYWEDFAPGAGRREPRADSVTNARTLDLSGTWRFRLSPTAAGTGRAFIEPGFDDSGWDDIRVPSHWVLEAVTPLSGGPARSLRGTDEGPLYTNTALPIPLDPPRVPSENPTGDYRLVFDVPGDWRGAVLRFQGVDSCAKVWLNGRELGWSTGSRLPFEFDAPVVAGENVLAVRVHRWSGGTYLEDQDMWWLPGIFREVELLERRGGIDDHFVHADFDHVTRLGTLRVDASAPGIVDVPELGIHVRAGETTVVPVDPWSAESPRLYRGTLTSEDGSETHELAIGFRSVEIVDGTLRVNGRKVFFRGVNRHEHHPETGRTLDRETMRRDILLMKQHNINAVRTSHYPPHPEFLRLCDELGLWVVEEGDLETHGFIYSGWEGNPPADPRWRDALLDRTRRMVERDKNRPSVVIWSIANESWVGENFDALEEWIRGRDSSRPIHYERDPSYRNSDFASLMYPSQELLEQIGTRSDPRPAGISDEEDARRRSLPFLLCEYAHAMGNGPGSLGDYHRILRSHERFCGGFVWEWIDHGFTSCDAEGREFTMHGGDVAYRPNGGRYCLDGLVFADRTPSPALAELKRAVQPVEIVVADTIQIRNDYDHVSLDHLTFRWRLELDGEPRAKGDLAVPFLAPGESVTLPSPTTAVDEPGEWWLTVEAVLAEDAAWASTGHVVAWAQGRLAEHRASPARRSASTNASRGVIHLGPAAFDEVSGRLLTLGGLELDGPRLDVVRAPTENDRGQGGNANDLAAVWRAVGIDRMLDRVDSVERFDERIVVAGRLAAAAHPHALVYRFTWSGDDDGVSLEAAVEFTGPWADTPHRHRNVVLPRLGLRLGLPGAYRFADWFGRGPSESYADSKDAAVVGRHGAAIDDLQVPYPVPQENGNHVDTRWLELRGEGLPVLRVEGAPMFDFTARRWTSEDLERARHPHDLVDSGRVWLNVDHAQLGLGSASVGPALPERYRIPREAVSLRVRFAVR
ncbi:glycoside hydrolase family 2 TIM barrel-domain containing protein [Herbiconiux sp. SYSU D00978]|uniref:glycoside hydrolase family 2 TIM barrel-domain containing protein n=1 Tax=Herbiconiux sp. SYSU D00978 TaxID=2812562 RepID=UPI001A96B326|nr:glycoside hydrolase family 2 TIM barrel-domain containing protein [Herbiconiux sp. SYSU D00978]